jgi:hypothetical protein
MRVLSLVLASVLATSGPASAATPIKLSPDKSWKHKATGIVFAPVVAGLQRQGVAWYSAPEVDVSGDYWSADGNDAVTIYLFRNVSGDVPVWFDRARTFITHLPDKYGTVAPTGIRHLVPRGQDTASALFETYRSGAQFK